MNIKKIATLIIVGAVALFTVAPTDASAATSPNLVKAKALFKKLKKLPFQGSRFSVVNSYVKKLSKLNPSKAAKYYRVGLTKLAPSQTAGAIKLGNQVAKIVRNSGLPDSQANKIVRDITTEQQTFTPPPTPYQAFIPSMESFVTA